MKKIAFLCMIGLALVSNAQINFKKVVTDADSVKFLNDEYFAVKKNSKWGVMKNTTLILDYYYDAIDVLSDGVITFIKNAQVGFADTLGNVITLATYETDTPYERADKSPLNVFECGSALVSYNGKLILLGKDANPITDENIEIISKYGNTVVYKKNGAYGMMDAMGHMLTENKFRQIQTVIAGQLYAYTGQNNGRDFLGLLDAKGTVKSPAQFEDLTIINKGDKYFIKAFVSTGKQALYTSDGDMIFSPLYQNVEPTEDENYFVMTDNTRKGIIGKDYITYIPAQYDNIQIRNIDKQTLFIATQDNMKYILSKDNKTIDNIDGNIKDFISYKNNDLIYIADSMLNFGVRSSKRGWLLQPQYLDIFAQVKDIYVVRSKDKWGAVDLNNNTVIAQEYKKIRASASKTCIVFYEGKHNSIVLNDKGEQFNFPKVDDVLPMEKYVDYKDKKEKVRLYLDGKEIRKNFIGIGSEVNGKLCAQTKQGWSYYDAQTYEPLTDQFYSYATAIKDARAFVVKDKKLLMIDDQFNVIETVLDENYKNLTQTASVLSMLKKSKKKYIVADEKNGKLTVLRAMK